MHTAFTAGPPLGNDSGPLGTGLSGGILQGLKGVQLQLLYVQARQLPPWTTLSEEWFVLCHAAADQEYSNSGAAAADLISC